MIRKKYLCKYIILDLNAAQKIIFSFHNCSERNPQSLQHEKDCKEISENLPRLARLPGNRCYFKDIFKSGICVQSSCLEVRLCRARGRKIMGKCNGVDELCCL